MFVYPDYGCTYTTVGAIQNTQVYIWMILLALMGCVSWQVRECADAWDIKKELRQVGWVAIAFVSVQLVVGVLLARDLSKAYVLFILFILHWLCFVHVALPLQRSYEFEKAQKMLAEKLVFRFFIPVSFLTFITS
jgi:hypothetical protein